METRPIKLYANREHFLETSNTIHTYIRSGKPKCKKHNKFYSVYIYIKLGYCLK